MGRWGPWLFFLLLLHFKLSKIQCLKKGMYVCYCIILPGVQRGTQDMCTYVKAITNWPNWSWQFHYHKRNHCRLPQKKQGRGEPNRGRKVIPSVSWLSGERRSRQWCVSHMRSWIGHQQLLLMLEQGFSLKGSQFLSLAKQELILTVLCNTREPRRLEKAGWGVRRATGWQDEGGGREWKSPSQALKGTRPRTASC